MRRHTIMLACLLGLLLATVPRDVRGSYDIIIDHRTVNSTVAIGTLSFNRLYPDEHQALVSSFLSDETAHRFEDETGTRWPSSILANDPRLEAFGDTWGTMTNLDFLTSDLEWLGDPVSRLENLWSLRLNEINPSIGGGATLTISPATYVGTASFTLYGGIVDDTYEGDRLIKTVVTGTANVSVYEVNVTITIPEDTTIIPEPSAVLVWSALLVCVALCARFRRRRPLGLKGVCLIKVKRGKLRTCLCSHQGNKLNLSAASFSPS